MVRYDRSDWATRESEPLPYAVGGSRPLRGQVATVEAKGKAASAAKMAMDEEDEEEEDEEEEEIGRAHV